MKKNNGETRFVEVMCRAIGGVPAGVMSTIDERRRNKKFNDIDVRCDALDAKDNELEARLELIEELVRDLKK